MRGEYKVPGGKLVAAEVEVTDGRLSTVHISGDFFLEPDTALEVIDAALTGRPADARVAELTEAIDTALARAESDGSLPEPVTMVGFTAEAVAIAVRRALGHATGWQDHTFEVIHPGPLPPATLGALDQVLTEELAAGRRGPTLRFWEWNERAVFIGSFQSLRNEVDPEGVAKHDVTVVRRISGGGAMFMEAGNCITFSLVVPASLVDGLSFEQSYRFLDDWVIGALAEVGVTATFAGLNDIASPAGKIAGSAQKRLAGGAVLHHMTMAYDIDSAKMLEVLRIGREKLSDKGTTSANKRVDPVRSQTGMAREDVIAAFDAYFRSRYRAVDSELRPEEIARAEQLVAEKFGNPEWTARVP
ncbi:lipoate--protein ligase family protein [Cellulomonas denverensis]|uniref:Lipoate--protein ligase family protein n=1 Tax=Cellulomonas denverensis TaxID=264297 RepID=A0A7X6KXR3_9CELL|nr:biotin/lipoate A/B protein ligase family protein [Cellulomonas denverensis]NKY24136.1 lipoate--protein ligase family protein [Cellulomonas denverensis]GIG25314.1 lipoate--protein ligase A [Cellulomonas denverensis]